MVWGMTKNDIALTKLSAETIRENIEKCRVAHAEGLQAIIDNYELLLSDRDKKIEEMQNLVCRMIDEFSSPLLKKARPKLTHPSNPELKKKRRAPTGKRA